MKKLRKTMNVLSLDRFNIPGIYVLIFSFIEDNKTCYNFSLVCKQAYQIFDFMIRKSSARKQKLVSLNEKIRVNNKFDIFKGNGITSYKIPQQGCCQNMEEFENQLANQKFVKSYHLNYMGEPLVINEIPFNNECDDMFFEILKKYDNVFVSGGYIVSSFFKKKILANQDIDVFLLGENKVKTKVKTKVELCKKIIREIYEKIKILNGFKFFVNTKRGLVEIRIKKIGGFFRKYQFILKENAKTPGDIFNFFDLDCCKIGYFPYFPKTLGLVCNVDFIRAIIEKKNYLSMVKYDRGIKKRIYKYFERFGIFTSFEYPHLMSYYHDFKRENCNYKEIVDFDIRKYRFKVVEEFEFDLEREKRFYCDSSFIYESISSSQNLEEKLKHIECVCNEKALFCEYYGSPHNIVEVKYGRKREYKTLNSERRRQMLLSKYKLCFICEKGDKIVEKCEKILPSKQNCCHYYHLFCLLCISRKPSDNNEYIDNVGCCHHFY